MLRHALPIAIAERGRHHGQPLAGLEVFEGSRLLIGKGPLRRIDHVQRDDVVSPDPNPGERIADLSCSRPAAKPAVKVALTGARIVTMNGCDQVIENGVVVIQANRIAAVR